MNLKNWPKKSFSCLVMFMAMTGPVWAGTAGGNLPFTSSMNTLKDGISGPFLLSASIIMIVVTCLMLAFGEFGDGFKKIINIVLWLSIAFGAVAFVTTMFGTGAVF